MALGSHPSTLDPRYATDADGMRIGSLIFESLVHAGPNFKPQPEAAESWEYKNHFYTFRLRPHMRFHNGRGVTPQDLIYSVDFFRGNKSPFGSALTNIKGVEASQDSGPEDQLILKLQVDHSSDSFLLSHIPIIKILPRDEVERLKGDFSQRLIGSGPYRFTKLDLNEIQLESFYARTKFLKFKIIRDDFTRFQKLIKGEVDLAQAEMPPDKIHNFEERKNEFQVIRYPGLSMTYLVFNFKDPLLRRFEVRRALAQSIRRDEIIRFRLNGLAREATSILTPNNPYFNRNLKNQEFNIAAAQETIRNLGLRGKHLILKTSNLPQVIDNGKILANQLSQSGLGVGLQSFEWGTFYGDVKQGRFQIALMKWVGTTDPEIYHNAFHSREVPPGRNRGSYSNAQLDLILDQAEAVQSPASRRRLYSEAQRIVHEDLAILPLWYDEQVAVARKNVIHYDPSTSSNFLPLAEVEKLEDSK